MLENKTTSISRRFIMGRLIPKKTKVKTEFFKGLTLTDGVILLIALIVLALDLFSDFAVTIRLILALVVIMIVVIMMINIAPETRTYQMIGDLFRYMFSVKHYKKEKHATRKSVNALMPYTGILEQDYDEKHKISVYDPRRAETEHIDRNIKYHIEFFRSGLNTIIKMWLADGCRESPEEMAEILKSEYRGR